MKKQFLLFFSFLPISVLAILGGNHTFSFLDMQKSPRSVAMGGMSIAIVDDDVSLAQVAPSLLNNRMHRVFSFSVIDYFADLNSVSAYYAHDLNSFGVISIGIDAMDYGSFIATDATGAEQGTFTANDQLMTLGVGKLLASEFSFGANIKFLNSNYEDYHSFAISSDISATYYNKGSEFVATFILKNLGGQLVSYTNWKEEKPLELQFGLSKLLKHLPFRYSLGIHNLNTYDIGNSFSPQMITDPVTQKLVVKEETIAKNILRHFVIGGELNPFRKNLYIRGGFNFQRRFDLVLDTYPAMVGFSWGLGFKVSNFHFNYARSAYHLSAVTNYFSITTNLANFGF